MAERRMFSTSVIGTDDFLDLPATAKVLYLYLMGEADDDGFIDRIKGIMRMVGAKSDDMKVLVAQKYLISFESGVVVIAHWKMHNSVRKDMYKPTKYAAEKETLVIENGVYRPRNESVTSPLQDRNESVTSPLQGEGETSNGNVTLDKIRIDKDRLDKDSVVVAATTACARAREVYENNIHPVCSEIEMQKIEDDVGHYGEDVFIKAIERAVLRGNRSLGYIEGILKRWETHGYDDGKAGGRTGTSGQEARDDYVRTNEALLREWAGDDWDSGG